MTCSGPALVLVVAGLLTACSTQSAEPSHPAEPTSTATQLTSTPASSDACWDRFVSFCPNEGPTTCVAKNGDTVTLARCSDIPSGHCVSNHCVVGPAACDALSTIPTEGSSCTGDLACGWTSRMGNAQCDCRKGAWHCQTAGI